MRRDALDQHVAQTLVIALAMIMGDKIRHGSAEVTLTEWNHAIETLLFDADRDVHGLERKRPVRPQRRQGDRPVQCVKGGHTFEEFLTIMRTGHDFDGVHPTCTGAPSGSCVPAVHAMAASVRRLL